MPVARTSTGKLSAVVMTIVAAPVASSASRTAMTMRSIGERRKGSYRHDQDVEQERNAPTPGVHEIGAEDRIDREGERRGKKRPPK